MVVTLGNAALGFSSAPTRLVRDAVRLVLDAVKLRGGKAGV